MYVPGVADVVERAGSRRREVDAVVGRDRERQRGERHLGQALRVPVLRRAERRDVVDPPLGPVVHVVPEQHGVAPDDAVGHLVDGIPLDDAPDDLAVDHRLGHRARRDAVVDLEPDVREVDHLVALHVVLPYLRDGERSVDVALVVSEDRAADVPVVHLAEIAREASVDVVHVEMPVLGEAVEPHPLRVHHHPEEPEVAADEPEHLDLVRLRAVPVPERAEVAGRVDALRAGVLVERAEVDVPLPVLAHSHVYLSVRVDALAALAVELGEVDDVAHLLRRGVELVEVRGLGVRAKAYVHLPALRAVERAPHGLLAVVPGEPVVPHGRLLLLGEVYLLRGRRQKQRGGHCGRQRHQSCRCNCFHVLVDYTKMHRRPSIGFDSRPFTRRTSPAALRARFPAPPSGTPRGRPRRCATRTDAAAPRRRRRTTPRPARGPSASRRRPRA